MTDPRHELPEDPDPNELAGDFGVDPGRERAGELEGDKIRQGSADEGHAGHGNGGRLEQGA